MRTEQKEKIVLRKTFLYFSVLFVVVSFTYSNHFNNSFHFDDSHTIENNLFIRSITNIPLFFKDGTTFSSLPQNQSYRPIVSTSLAIDYWLGNGFNLFYFHISSFVLYLLQGFLMFFFIFKLFDTSYKNNSNFYIASFAVALYLLHPANAETINYIIARSDLQSTFFVIFGFVMYLSSAKAKKYYLYLIPVALGTLAKPPSVMFAPMLFFYVLLFEQKISLMNMFTKKHFPQLISTIKTTLPAFILCAMMYLWVEHFTPKTWESGSRSTFNYLISQPFVIVHYFTTFFLPFGLSADTDWEPLQNIWNIKFFIGCAFLLSLLIIVFLLSRDRRLRPVSFGIIWFLLALIPSSSVIPFAEILNDHRMFFPFVGLVIAVCYPIGLLIIKFKKRNQNTFIKYEVIIAFSLLIILSGYSYGTYQRNKVWLTEETLWEDVTYKSPHNARGLMNYGLSKMKKGDYTTAEKYFTDALVLWPQYSFLYVNLGVLKEATGNVVSAENCFKQGVQLGNNYPDCHYFYGRFLANQRRYTEAIAELKMTIQLSSAHIGSRSLLMKVYYLTADKQQLKKLAESTLQVLPDNSEAIYYLKDIDKLRDTTIIPLSTVPVQLTTAEDYLNISLTYYNKAQYEKCIDACTKAIELKPDYADAYSNIGASYNQLKQWDKAIEACNKALKINPRHKLANGNLNWAIKEKGYVK